MGQLTKNSGLLSYVDTDTWKFGTVSKDAELSFEFDFKQDEKVIDYIDPGCGCTKAWFEDGKIKGTLSIPRAGNFVEGEHHVGKSVTVMLFPEIPYHIGGPKKEKKINENKPYLRLNIAGTVLVEPETGQETAIVE